jgi:hypothetical protein
VKQERAELVVPVGRRQISIGSNAARASPGIAGRPSAASLSIEPFEVSRLRLRRTRPQPVWVSNGVLVLGGPSRDGVNAGGRCRRRLPENGQVAPMDDNPISSTIVVVAL